MKDIDPHIYRGDGSVKRKKTREEIQQEKNAQHRAECMAKQAEQKKAEEAMRQLKPEPDFPGDER